MVVAVLSVVPDGQARRVVLGDTTLELLPGERTATWLVVRDSLPLEVFQGEQLTARQTVRFLRQMLHLLVVTTVGGRDTIGLFLQPLSLRDASLRLLNLAATGNRYGLQFGCPNAPLVTGWVGPVGESAPVAVPLGRSSVVTVLEEGNNGPRVLGSWRLSLDQRGLYSLLVWGAAGALRVGLLDEKQAGPQRVQQLEPVEGATARVRVLNLSTEALSVVHRPSGQAVVTGVASQWVSSSVPVPACLGAERDSFWVTTSSGRTLAVTASLEPFRDFTLVVLDSAGQLRGWIGRMEPAASGIARVRLLHAVWGAPPVRVVVGAVGSGGRFASGVVLSESIAFGEVSEPESLTVFGDAPLLVLGRDFPSTVLAAALSTFAPGRSGFLCVVPAASSPFGFGLAWIDDEVENAPVALIPEGYPVQLLQGIPATVSVELPPAIDAVRLPYRTVAVTVVPPEGRQLSIGTQRWAVEAVPDSIPLLVVSGTAEAPVLFRFAVARRWDGPWGGYRRFINASDIEAVDIVIDTIVGGQRSEYVLLRGLPRGGASAFELIPLEYRFSFRIRDSNSGTLLARVENVLFPLGRRYSVIFVGNRADGYSVVVHQEL